MRAIGRNLIIKIIKEGTTATKGGLLLAESHREDVRYLEAKVINVGDEVNFIVNAVSHPFYIKTAQGKGADNQVSIVTNNGATSGVVNWTPSAAGTYYYQCSAHDGMYGTITVQ